MKTSRGPCPQITRKVFVVSDVHFACDRERLRPGYEYQVIRNPALRLLVRAYRHWIWLRDPFAHNRLLGDFCQAAESADLVVANGDYSCDTAFVGVSDDASCASAAECLSLLRKCFPDRFRATIGDHELGKVSLFGGCGGLRLASWDRTLRTLRLAPLWQERVGARTLLGLTSTLLALPVFGPECLRDEREAWELLRSEHLREIERVLDSLPSNVPILLFLHDPSALPFLAELPAMQRALPRLEMTIIGHLHSPLILAQSRLLSGMPPIRFLGNAVRRMSTALSRARTWRPFKVRLCPSLAGLELLKDGGYLELTLKEGEPTRVFRHRLRRRADGTLGER